MTKPTPVTTSTITQESGSSSIPQSATKRTTSLALVYIGPAGTHSNRIFWKTRCSGSAPSNCSTAPSAKTKDNNTLPTHSTLTDRKSTRLNSSHGYISYAVFCLKKKKKISDELRPT